MGKCTSTDINQEQSNTLLRAISSFIWADTNPSTIVDYVCAQLDIPAPETPAPEISAANWCLLTCISSCLFKYAVLTPPSSYTYVSKPTTYTCVVSCFPVFPGETSSSSGAGAPTGSAAAENLAKWKDEQADKVINNLFEGNMDWLQSMLNMSLTNLAITIASYSTWIAIQAEHLSEVTAANIMKRIGDAIETVAATLKKTQDFANAAVDMELALATGQTELIVPPIVVAQHAHFTGVILAKNVWGALTKQAGFITDFIGDTGEFIEHLGQFMHDAADMLWDLKTIAFSLACLATTIYHIKKQISDIVDRMDKAVKSTETMLSTSAATFESQIKNAVSEKVNMDEFNSKIKSTISGKARKLGIS